MTGVVAGDAELVGQFAGDAAHHRSLAGIAVAAAAEHTPQPPAAGRGEGAQRAQRLVQRIRRMGVVHHHLRQLDRGAHCARGCGHPVHAAGHRREVRRQRHRLRQRQAQCAQSTQYGQQVGHVVVADEATAQVGTANFGARRTLHHGERQATGLVVHVLGAQAGFARVGHAVRPQLQATLAAQLLGELGAPGIVQVQHRGAQAGPVEQAALGGPIRSHVGVVVEVVRREVGEQRHRDAGRGQALLDQADR